MDKKKTCGECRNCCRNCTKGGRVKCTIKSVDITVNTSAYFEFREKEKT